MNPSPPKPPPRRQPSASARLATGTPSANPSESAATTPEAPQQFRAEPAAGKTVASKSSAAEAASAAAAGALPPAIPPGPPRPSAPTKGPRAAALERKNSALPLTEAAKQALTLKALGLLNEQVQARIVHYKGELETNAELDAITAQVVTQLKEMQAAARQQAEAISNVEDIEQQHITTLTALLQKLLMQGEQSGLITRNIKPIARRIAKLFFESELHEKTKAEKEKVIHHAEQGVYYVLGRYKHRLRTELEGFEYVNSDIRSLTLELLAKLERDLQVGFLSRRSPELNRVMTVFTSVLVDFFHKHLPGQIAQLAKLTIMAAKTARQSNSVSYKVQHDRFSDFRREWERLLMEQMIDYCSDQLLARLGEASADQEIREETVRFITDPHVFSETCEVLCAHLYDHLCVEGFLDLPVDWRQSHA